MHIVFLTTPLARVCNSCPKQKMKAQVAGLVPSYRNLRQQRDFQISNKLKF